MGSFEVRVEVEFTVSLGYIKFRPQVSYISSQVLHSQLSFLNVSHAQISDNRIVGVWGNCITKYEQTQEVSHAWVAVAAFYSLLPLACH